MSLVFLCDKKCFDMKPSVLRSVSFSRYSSPHWSVLESSLDGTAVPN